MVHWTGSPGEEEEAPQEEATEALKNVLPDMSLVISQLASRKCLFPQCHRGMNVAGEIPGPHCK